MIEQQVERVCQDCLVDLKDPAIGNVDTLAIGEIEISIILDYKKDFVVTIYDIVSSSSDCSYDGCKL